MLKRRYARVSGLLDVNITETDRDWRADMEAKKHYLAYLEKRRWNAFVRSLGYRRSNERNFSLKLHPCLVEARGPQAGEVYDYNAKGITDYLDAVGDYKGYDYPHDDVGDLMTYRFFVAWNRTEDHTLKVPALDEKALLKRCEQSAEKGVYFDDSIGIEDWIIPVACLKSWLSADEFAQLKKEML